MPRFIFLLFIAAFVAEVSPFAQSPAGQKPSFEVASVKPYKNDNIPSSWSSRGGRQTIIGVTTRFLIMNAFNLHDHEVSGGPSWIDSERFDVIAKAEGNPKVAELRLMMQSLLEERFALKYRRETKDGPVYRLALARKDGTLGAQLVTSTDVDCDALPRRGENPDEPGDVVRPCMGRMGPGHVVARTWLFTNIVSFLEGEARRRIIDDTGLTGKYDFSLTWAYSEEDTTRPSFFTAVQQQLGLRLESARGPVNTLVIEHIERPTAD